MPLIHKRSIWWQPVLEAKSYIVYVSPDKAIFDLENFLWEATPGVIFRVVEGKTELIIPDEWPEFPKSPGIYYVGITSRDEMMNQSDPLLLKGVFKFTPPPAPHRGGIRIIY